MQRKIEKIIFLVCWKFDKRDYERFGIETLRQNGFSVEVWDFGPFLRPGIYKGPSVSNPPEYSSCRIFKRRSQATSALAGLSEGCFLVCTFAYTPNTYVIYRSISRNRLRYGIVMANASPLQENNLKLINLSGENIKKMTFPAILRKLKQLLSVNTLNVLFQKINFSWLGIQPADIVLAGGEKSMSYLGSTLGKNSKIIWIHSLDYDIYLNELKKNGSSDAENIVFLDENVPFNPDYKHLKLAPFSNPEEYYPVLRNFFDLLEHEFGFSVIIAAHPSSNEEELSAYFGNRQVFKGKTVELVRMSRFTIVHTSASLGYAILFKKPVVFVTTNRLDKSLLGPSINFVSSLLGKKPINLDNNYNFNPEQEFSVNDIAYRDYRRKYLKTEGSQDLPFWQVFADSLKQICN